MPVMPPPVQVKLYDPGSLPVAVLVNTAVYWPLAVDPAAPPCVHPVGPPHVGAVGPFDPEYRAAMSRLPETIPVGVATLSGEEPTLLVAFPDT